MLDQMKINDENKYRQLFEYFNSGIAICRPLDDGEDFSIINMNEYGQNISHIKFENIQNKNCSEILSGVEQLELLRVMKDVWITGNEKYHLSSLVNKNNQKQWIKYYVLKLNSHEIAIVYEDVSEKIKAEEIIVSLSKFPSENPNPVLRATKDEVLYSNLAGQNILHLHDGDKTPDYLCTELSQALNLNSIITTLVPIQGAIYSLAIMPIKEEGYANIYGNDVTEQIISREKLQISEKNYKVAYEKATFYKDLFVHDMNNILQSMLLGIQLSETILSQSGGTEALKENISAIKNQIMRGANLVKNIRNLNEIEEKKRIFTPTNIVNRLEKTIERIKKSYKDNNISILVDNRLDNFIIKADQLLENIFENIIYNAIQHNDKSNIEIEIILSEIKIDKIEHVRIEFQDNGSGIEGEFKNMIFDRGFYDQKNVHGMGLGLSLVKKIIELYNGHIWVEDRIKNKSEMGSNFIVELPRQ